MKDVHSHMLATVAIGAAVLAATSASEAIDLQGYSAAEILLSVGAGGVAFSDVDKIEFVLTHSDDAVTYDPVTVGDMLGLGSVGDGGIIKALTEAHATAAVYRCGYVGNRRYLKLQASFSGTHGAGTPISATVMKMRGHDTPEVDQA